MARQELTISEISQLEALLINEEYYLTSKIPGVKPDPDNPEVGNTKVFRFKYPNYAQQSKANRMKQSFIWEISEDKQLKDSAQVAELKKKEIAEIKKTIDPLKKRFEDLQVEIQKRKGELPNPDTEPEKFQTAYNKLTQPLEDIITKLTEESVKLEQIFALSTDHLVAKEYDAILTYLCWSEQGDQEDTWVPIWKTYEEFKQDSRLLATVLLNKTSALSGGGSSFFGISPLPVIGVKDT